MSCVAAMQFRRWTILYLLVVCFDTSIALNEIVLDLPIPRHDSSIARIFDSEQLRTTDSYVRLKGFASGERFKLICSLDELVNVSAIEFIGDDMEETMTLSLPTFQDGPHTIAARVFTIPDEEVVASTSIDIEVRAGWDGNLRDESCPRCEFTTDWTKEHIDDWHRVLAHFKRPTSGSENTSDVHGHLGFDVLEIGSWEGRSAIWMARNLHVRSLTCVDTWVGGEDHNSLYWRNVVPLIERRFDHNLQAANLSEDLELIKRVGSSYEVLPELLADGRQYDLVYVDGAHTPQGVAFDLVLSLHLLRPGGVALLDDYEYSKGVRAVADAIVQAHAAASLVEVIHSGRQLAVRKNREIAAHNWGKLVPQGQCQGPDC